MTITMTVTVTPHEFLLTLLGYSRGYGYIITLIHKGVTI